MCRVEGKVKVFLFRDFSLGSRHYNSINTLKPAEDARKLAGSINLSSSSRTKEEAEQFTEEIYAASAPLGSRVVTVARGWALGWESILPSFLLCRSYFALLCV
jgi:hypothetical protein